jgi:uncharacterized repeat protein (TIGR01451 family)
MDTARQRARSLRHAAGATLSVMLTAMLAALLGGGTAAAAPADAPQLSIAVDNGRTSADTGDSLVYTITVRNLGTDDLKGLTVTQSVPTGLEFGTADHGGRTTAGNVGWSLNLKAASEAIFTSTMTVSATPAELLRLATVACASTSADGPPIVCASHSDQLPAGASAEAAAAAPAPSPGLLQLYLMGGIAVVLIAVAVVVVVIRRRTTWAR